MVDLILSLGGNFPDTLHTFERVKIELQKHIGNMVHQSLVYQSSAWGMDDNTPPFLNQVVVLQTQHSPQQVLETLQDIEWKFGRKKELQVNTQNRVYKNRLIDVDILFYGNRTVNTKNLQIPHPLLHKRQFILVPIHEILPNFVHPVLKKTMKELHLQCEDKLPVTPI